MTDEELERLARKVIATEGKGRERFWALSEFSAISTPHVFLALLERVRKAEARVKGLEEVAKEVESLTADVAENGRCSDCPYVSQERAQELLAIIRGEKP